jgi:hypothetical protein
MATPDVLSVMETTSKVSKLSRKELSWIRIVYFLAPASNPSNIIALSEFRKLGCVDISAKPDQDIGKLDKP